MKLHIKSETVNQVQSMFVSSVESGKYRFDEFDKFLNDVILHGIVIMDKIVSGHIDEDDLSDIDEVIILSRENMFSEN